MSGRMRVLAVALLLSVAAVEAWLAMRGVGRGRVVAATTAALLLLAAGFVGRPRRPLGGRGS